MTLLDHILGSLDIRIFAVHHKVPETLQETVYAVDSSVIPFCVQFRRAYEQFVHPEGIASVVSYQIIRGNHVSFGLAHLDAILAGDHSLVEQFMERLVKVDRSDVI